MGEPLIALVDGGIWNVRYDDEAYLGCETCDYGSEYIKMFDVEMDSGTIHVEVSQMYDYAISEDFMMKLFLQNVDTIKQMTENQFFEWLKLETQKEVDKNYGWRDKDVQATFTKNNQGV